MTNIFLTGATGYIGSHLLKGLLEEENYHLYIIVRPTSDINYISDVIDKVKVYEYTGFDSLYRIFTEEEVDLVIHLAGYVGSGLEYREVDQNINGNILLSFQLFEAMRLNGVNKIINTGSYWEFGDESVELPKTIYAIYKSTVRELLAKYTRSYGFKVINLILYDVYGEDDQRDKVIPTLLRMDNKEEIEMTPGYQKLDFIHIQDVIKGYKIAAKNLIQEEDNKTNKTYHLCTGELITLRELVKKIEKIFNKQIKANWGAKVYSHYQIMHPISRGRILPGWDPEIKIDEGLGKIFKSP